jgi:hypothetical protein
MLSVSRGDGARVTFALILIVGTTAAIGASNHTSHFAAEPVPARDAMISVLGAMNPSPSLGDESRIFDRLIGAWDADFTFPHDDGTTTRKKGELLFGWVLDGHAMQDLWISYPADSSKHRTIGTTIWFFDTSTKRWRIVFVGPQSNSLVMAQGGRVGNRIVFHGVGADGVPFRWTFRDITADAFRWQGERSHDGGKTWKLEEDNHMTRRRTTALGATRVGR